MSLSDKINSPEKKGFTMGLHSPIAAARKKYGGEFPKHHRMKILLAIASQSGKNSPATYSISRKNAFLPDVKRFNRPVFFFSQIFP